MEITDQDISDFIKSRGKFTYTKAEPSPHFYFDPNKGDVWEYRIEIFGIDVWHLWPSSIPRCQAQSHFHDQNILDEIRDNLIKAMISNYREKILKILRREENLNYLLNGRD